MKIPKWLVNIILRKMGVIPMFTQIQTFLSGKKTYLLTISGIIGALIKYSVDGNVAECLTAIWAALGLSTLRSAVGK